MNILDKILLTILGSSALLILVAVPLALRKIPRNIVYGLRTRATLSNEETWYSANVHFGRGLIVWSLVADGAAIGLRALGPLPPRSILTASVVLITAPGFIAMAATLLHIRSSNKPK